jgi:putative transposase
MVRQDLPEPKQLVLFETPSSESTLPKRRQHRAQSSKRGVPGNLGVQLDLFFQDNNNGTTVPRCESPATFFLDKNGQTF